MPDFRVVYAPLALLITISSPSHSQTQGSQGQSPQGQRHGAQGQDHRPQGQAQGQGQRRHGQGQVQGHGPQGQAPHGQGQGSSQTHRRNNPGIQIYRGPSDYHAGSKPSLDVQHRYRNRSFDQYRHEYRSERRYHVRPYIRPHGWYSYEWTLGAILPTLFWPHNYRITDYWLYGLPVPPYDCIWVRYEHDALLINRRTGEVIEVIYDVFY